MAAVQYPTSEQIKEISDRFISYHAQLDHLVSSLMYDIGTLYPPFTGRNSEQESLEATVLELQQISHYLQDFSEHYLRLIPDPVEPDISELVAAFKD